MNLEVFSQLIEIKPIIVFFDDIASKKRNTLREDIIYDRNIAFIDNSFIISYGAIIVFMLHDILFTFDKYYVHIKYQNINKSILLHDIENIGYYNIGPYVVSYDNVYYHIANLTLQHVEYNSFYLLKSADNQYMLQHDQEHYVMTTTMFTQTRKWIKNISDDFQLRNKYIKSLNYVDHLLTNVTLKYKIEQSIFNVTLYTKNKKIEIIEFLYIFPTNDKITLLLELYTISDIVYAKIIIQEYINSMSFVSVLKDDPKYTNKRLGKETKYTSIRKINIDTSKFVTLQDFFSLFYDNYPIAREKIIF